MPNINNTLRRAQQAQQLAAQFVKMNSEIAEIRAGISAKAVDWSLLTAQNVADLAISQPSELATFLSAFEKAAPNIVPAAVVARGRL